MIVSKLAGVWKTPEDELHEQLLSNLGMIGTKATGGV
jgi:hypothetical protein